MKKKQLCVGTHNKEGSLIDRGGTVTLLMLAFALIIRSKRERPTQCKAEQIMKALQNCKLC